MSFTYGRRGRPTKGQQVMTHEMKNYEGVGEVNRPVHSDLLVETRPRPAWMDDPSLLPKRPPGRAA